MFGAQEFGIAICKNRADHIAVMLPLSASALSGSQTGAFAGADWIERLITGPLGTSLAVIAVAWFGFALLGGRLPFRRGGLLVLGCFVLFSAPVMARALLGLAQQSGGGAAEVQPQEIVVPPPPPAPSPPAYDPYAGASVPG